MPTSRTPIHVALAPLAGRGTSIVADGRFAFAAEPDAFGLYELLGSSDPWRDIVKTVAKSIVGESYDHPAIALFEVSEAGTAWFIFGELEVQVETASDVIQLETTSVSTWVESQIDEQIVRVQVGAEAEAFGHLTDGYVNSGGLIATIGSSAGAQDTIAESESDELHVTRPTEMSVNEMHEMTIVRGRAGAPESNPPEPVVEPEPSTAPEPAPTDHLVEPAIAEDSSPADESSYDPNATTSITGAQLSAIRTEAVDVVNPRRPSAPATHGDPEFVRPTLRGIRCPNGHLNSMQDERCRTCGAAVDLAGPIESDVRPSLAIVTLDDGTVHPVDSPMAFGRNVPDPYSIGGEVASSIVLVDDMNLLSRVHLEMHLSGWDIELIDKGSANGTFTRQLGSAGAKTRLRPEYPTAISLDVEVELGGRRFTITAGPLQS